MYHIIKRSGKGHLVYSKEDADAIGLQYKPWREATPGDWALSDDQYVCEMLSQKGAFKVFTPGSQVADRKSHFLVGPHLVSGSYHSIGTSSWKQREIRRTRTKNAVQAYVKMFLMGKIDWQKLGLIYRPDQQIPEATVRRLFKLEGVKQLVDKELEKALTGKGISSSYVLDIIKEAIEMAKQNESPETMLKGAKELAEILRMKSDSKQISQEYGTTPAMLAEMEKVQDEVAKGIRERDQKAERGGSEGVVVPPLEDGQSVAPSIN